MQNLYFPQSGQKLLGNNTRRKKKTNQTKAAFQTLSTPFTPILSLLEIQIMVHKQPECSHSDKRKHLGPSTASQEIVPHVHSSECWEAAWPQGEETLLLSPSLGEKCHWSPRWEQIFPKGATMPTNLACSPCQIFISPSLAAVRSYKIRIMHYPTS